MRNVSGQQGENERKKGGKKANRNTSNKIFGEQIQNTLRAEATFSRCELAGKKK